MAKSKKLVWIIILLVSIIMVGCDLNDHNLTYDKFNDSEHLIKNDFFQVKTPDCFKVDFNGVVGDEGNVIGSMECEGSVIKFKYGRFLSETDPDTSIYSYSYFKKDMLEGVIKHQKGGYPKSVELLLQEIEEGEEYGHIKQSLFMSSVISNSDEANLIDSIYKSVKFSK